MFSFNIREEIPPLTEKEKNLLTNQVITAQQPGTILTDFDKLLKLIGPDGVTVSKTNYLLPLKALRELNNNLSHPLSLGLKRPQLKSFPNLAGLYLVLRSSGLTFIDNTTKKPKLMLDRAVLNSWLSLNPTEQYCNLLEIWLIDSSIKAIGEYVGNWRDNQLSLVINLLDPHYQQKFMSDKDSIRYNIGWYNVALSSLFGLLKIEDEPAKTGQGWQVKSFQLTPFGQALLKTIYHYVQDYIKKNIKTVFDLLTEPAEFSLQSIFQPYFPDWQHNLTIPEHQPKTGIYYFKVSWQDVWRRISISSKSTLDELSSIILNAYEFDNDHLDKFSYVNRFGEEISIFHPYMEEELRTDEISIDDLPLAPGDSLTYLFDFGDSWTFNVVLERIEETSNLNKAPVIIESHGEPPEQYPNWGDDWGDDWDEDWDEEDNEEDNEED